MPYLRITCPEISAERRAIIANQLTQTVVELFHNARGPAQADLREHTTIHFMPYADGELFIGGRTPHARGGKDITVELSDWHMSVRRQRNVARELTPVLMELFDVPTANVDDVNIRFHDYPPTDFAVGGRLLADVVPYIGQVMKRIFG